MEATYRIAQYDTDAETVAAVQVTAWKETYRGTIIEGPISNCDFHQRLAFWKSALQDASRWVTVCEVTCSPVGFVSVLETSSVSAELSALYVLAKYQGKGIGKRLFDMAQTYVLSKGYKEFFVLVLKGSPAQGFYNRMGGQVARVEQSEFLGTKVSLVKYVWH